MRIRRKIRKIKKIDTYWTLGFITGIIFGCIFGIYISSLF